MVVSVLSVLSMHAPRIIMASTVSVSYTHLRAHETRHDLVCRLLLEKKKRMHMESVDVLNVVVKIHVYRYIG